MKTHIFHREEMKPYIERAMRKAHEDGTPPMRPLFYDFPDDRSAWDISDEFLFGDALLVCPVTEYGARSRSVYLPAGCRWVDAYTGAAYDGGTTLEADAPLSHIPVFIKKK
jgi:alpha-D-xyloside xylohydrolase